MMNHLILSLALLSLIPAGARTAMPVNGATAFKDTSAFRTPSDLMGRRSKSKNRSPPAAKNDKQKFKDKTNRRSF
jgi:hypothetical protein